MIAHGAREVLVRAMIFPATSMNSSYIFQCFQSSLVTRQAWRGSFSSDSSRFFWGSRPRCIQHLRMTAPEFARVRSKERIRVRRSSSSPSEIFP